MSPEEGKTKESVTIEAARKIKERLAITVHISPYICFILHSLSSVVPVPEPVPVRQGMWMWKGRNEARPGLDWVGLDGCVCTYSDLRLRQVPFFWGPCPGRTPSGRPLCLLHNVPAALSALTLALRLGGDRGDRWVMAAGLSAAVVYVVSFFSSPPLPRWPATPPLHVPGGGGGSGVEGEKERSYETNGQAQQTRQTSKRHRFPFPAMPACIRPAAAAGRVLLPLPLPACAGLI